MYANDFYKRLITIPGMLKSTNQYKQYWTNRKIDWVKEYADTWNHPHRYEIIRKIEELRVPIKDVFEMGCATGPNLVLLKQKYPGVNVGGVDLNPEAIAVARATFKGLSFDVASVDNTYMADKCADIVLSDMCLIYLDKKAFRKALSEARRIATKGVVFCEFHSSSLLKRTALLFGAGYYAHDYKKELELAGFHDVSLEKFSDQSWPGGEPQKTFGYYITARI